MNEEYLSYVDYLKSLNFEKKLEVLKDMKTHSITGMATIKSLSFYEADLHTNAVWVHNASSKRNPKL